jgi:hypothetical protein
MSNGVTGVSDSRQDRGDALGAAPTVEMKPVGEQLDVGERAAVTGEEHLRLERCEPLQTAEVLKERAAARGWVAGNE